MLLLSSAYGSDIEEDVTGETSGHFKKMLVVLLQVSECYASSGSNMILLFERLSIACFSKLSFFVFVSRYNQSVN